MSFLLLLLNAGLVWDEGGLRTPTAQQLSMNMTREQVIAVMGRPDWAISADDTGEYAEELRLYSPGILFELVWDNPPCEPVETQFDSNHRLRGWSEGRALCHVEYDWAKDEKFSCEHADRQHLCH